MFEINEAFAAQSLAVIQELGLDPDKVRSNSIKLRFQIITRIAGDVTIAPICDQRLLRRNGNHLLSFEAIVTFSAIVVILRQVSFQPNLCSSLMLKGRVYFP